MRRRHPPRAKPTTRPLRGPTKPPAPPLDFEKWVVHEDDALLVVDKPAGVASQGGPGLTGTNLVDLGRAYTGVKSLAVLHRLDRNVSGLVVLAKTIDAARKMSALIAKGAMERTYVAIVRGTPRSESFVLDAPIAKDHATNEVRAAQRDELDAMSDAERAKFRPARTEVRVLEARLSPLGPLALLEVRPITGRSHQIRCHLAGASLPILGDPKYGVRAPGVSRPLLHATRLVFLHPNGRELALASRPPFSLSSVLRAAPSRARKR